MKKKIYWGCNPIAKSILMFNGCRSWDEFVGFCCEELPNESPPYIPLATTGKQTIDNFITMREKVIAESEMSKEERKYSRGCLLCPKYRQQIWPHYNDQIMYVNLSQYPSPCQCRCTYCTLRDMGLFEMTPEAEQMTEILLDAIGYALEKNLIHPKARWQVSCGEITIHPYKNRIYDLIGNAEAYFLTNMFLFDERIANNLSNNPKSQINFSIDSGTAATWKAVKGISNFDKVKKNLKEYSHAICNGNQIVLKYIILLNVNTSLADYQGVIDIMKIIKVNTITISRNSRAVEDDSQDIITQTAFFVALLSEAELGFTLDGRFSEEQKSGIIELAKELPKG